MNLKNFFSRKYENKYLKIKLSGGLCNKIHCLISACDIALEKGSYLVEPDFGWNEKILFSDIYDIDFFNESMMKYIDGKKMMVSKSELSSGFFERLKIAKNNINLWKYSEKELKKERETCVLLRESTKSKVLRALRLKPEYEEIVKKTLLYNFDTAIQIRTEPDWVEYSKNKKASEPKESILVEFEDILRMISTPVESSSIFFTSGSSHKNIINGFKKINYSAHCFFNSALEYEINAAINFEVCSRAKKFIGNSRSSYSNLITLKRALVFENEESYIYNYNGRITRRIDKGLQPRALDSIERKTNFI